MEINMKENSSKRSQTGLEIAVIGMSGRFPGAKDIHSFWENLKNGVESITFFSDEELQEAGIAPEKLKNPNYVKAKGYIEDLEYFDASFFKYTPNEAAVMDPQLRLFHECSWHALEDAGYDPRAYNGLIGLYAGYTPNILWKVGHLYQSSGSGSEILELMNLNSDYFTALICYKLNLKGPGVTLNTACSTSLVAIHLACRALLTGEADIVLAGGVTVTLPWKNGYFYQEGMIMSPDGHCRPFDAGAQGTASGNGIAIVVLKRLVKAIKDGDHIYAVIKGTAINNDGNRKAGYTAVSVEGQARVIKAARLMAEVEPESITYIETHGIGTPLGDPLEIEALKKAFSQTTKKGFCRLGFLKANIGHLDSAAGAAAFFKTVLALKHRLIPPAVNFTSPNPKIDFDNSPFYPGKTLEEWHVDEYPLRAGVSSFGIGGTNAHVILEEAPETSKSVNQWVSGSVKQETEDGGIIPHKDMKTVRKEYQLILLSAKTETALDKMTANLVNHFKKKPGINLPDAAYTLQVGRSAFNYRRFLVCSSINGAIEGLLSNPSGGPGQQAPEVEMENPPLVFMFPGPGSQYVEMGLELYNSQPLFRQEMDRCFEILKPQLDYDIKEILYPSTVTPVTPVAKKINQIEIAGPLLFIFEYALAQLLLKAGIKPRIMIGDSLGEYTAACLAGVFSLEDALTLLISGGQSPRESGETVTPNEDRVGRLTLDKPAIPFISAVTGKPITPQDAVNPRYWATHSRQAGQFTAGLKELMQIENAVFIEVGPGMALSNRVQQYMDKQLNHPVVNLVRSPDREVSDLEYLLNRVGRLWLYGVPFDRDVFYTPGIRKRVPLPGYPFDKQYYNIEPPIQKLQIQARTGGPSPTPVSAPNRPELKTPYAAPQNRVEEILVQMWEDLLGIRPIGIHDDLMELGVDSLKAMTYVNRFKEKWGVIIHIATIFSAPTTAELADYINNHYPEKAARITGSVTGAETSPKEENREMANKIPGPVSENLLLLKETSPQAGNIFFLHEVSGDIGAYIEFCRLLETGLNCWGIQARRLKNYKPQNRTIEEIAGIYVEKIKQIQPEGPYYLVTWSGGGPIAFEMALQMEQGSDPPIFLAFIDCRGPAARLNNKTIEFTLDTEINFLKGLFAGTEMEEKLEKITGINHIWPFLVDVLKSNPAYKEGVESFINQDPMLTLLNFEGQRIEDLIQYMNLSRTFQNASSQYIPARKLHTPLHFFEGTEAPQDKPVYWHEYCINPVIKHKMSGDHYSIFKQPLVKEFTHVFNEVLEQINETKSFIASKPLE
jgi:acyl transferase domain-containing protein/thioesterase domain-containing protein/aryl carrier-like protein